MWDIVEGIHKALRIEATWQFVLVIGFGAFLIAGFFAWVIDTGFKNSAEYKADHSPKAVPTPPTTFLDVGKGASVEGMHLKGGHVDGYSSFAHVDGALKDFSTDNVDIDANGKGVAAIDSEELDYAGPPRYWIVPKKLFMVPLPDSPSKEGTKMGRVGIALRNGFAPKRLQIVISGNGILAADVTVMGQSKVMDAQKASNNKATLVIDHPVDTYELHIQLVDKPTSVYNLGWNRELLKQQTQ